MRALAPERASRPEKHAEIVRAFCGNDGGLLNWASSPHVLWLGFALRGAAMTVIELEALADKNRDRPLEILGCAVDKENPRQVYGALCWIEDQLGALLEARA